MVEDDNDIDENNNYIDDENYVDIVDDLFSSSNLAAVHAGGFATGIYQTNR